MTDALEHREASVSIGGRTIKNVCFADDIVALAGKEEELFKLVNQLNKASTTWYGDQCRKDYLDDQNHQRNQLRH